MPLPSPQLDDRDFEQLMAEAVARIRQVCPEWTDLSPGDPGIALVEVFAYLTETLLYRLNRWPEKAYIALLNLIGVERHPPAAATVTLVFTRRDGCGALEVPRGTQVTLRAGGGSGGGGPAEPPVFMTLAPARFAAGQDSVHVQALHAEQIEAELAGVGTGLPGQTVKARRAPILASSPDALEMVVGVQAMPDELDAQAVAIQHEGQSFRLWQVVDNFAQVQPGQTAVVVDRYAGQVTFAPALRLPGEDGLLGAAPVALAAVPAAGREIRLWYRVGGGLAGNVRAHSLTLMRQPVEGLVVDNPAPAAGGAEEESLENALARGPLSLHSLERAVTARDFELLAARASAAVNRARAYTQAALWAHGTPGTVEVLLVPQVNEPHRTAGPITPALLLEQQSDAVLAQVQQGLDLRRPLGTACRVGWAQVKTVRVDIALAVHRQEDAAAVQQRVRQRLDRLVCPVALGPGRAGWPFGQKLTAWDVLKSVGNEPGIAAIHRVRLCVDDAPDGRITSVSRDAFQPRTWYCGCGPVLYRSMNDGSSWEALHRFQEGDEVLLVKAYTSESGTQRERAGLVAVVVRQGESHRLYVSRDALETLQAVVDLAFEVHGLAWLFRGRTAVLLLASAAGLYEQALLPDAPLLQVKVDDDNPTLGFTAVAVSCDSRGHTTVALAGADEAGVYLSSQAGLPGTYRRAGLEGELANVLMVQHLGPHAYLWAGLAAAGRDKGKGCFRLRLTADGDEVEGWQPLEAGWAAGSCRTLAYEGARVYAGSLRLGVLWLDAQAATPSWVEPTVGCGLPLRDVGRLQPVNVAAAGGGRVMVGGPVGLHRSDDQGVSYVSCARRDFETEVSLPPHWVLCAGEHQIDVRSLDGTLGD